MDDKISRREAARKTIGAAAAIGTASMIKNVAAQTTPANSPSAPPKEPPPGAIAPNSVKGSDITFKSGETDLKAYFAAPAQGKPKAGILVIHEIWGLSDHIKDVTRRLAAQGYLAIAPDFYTRIGAPSLDPQNRDGMMKFLASLSDVQFVADGEAALSFLKGKGVQKVGSVGFCMGGLYSYLLAAKSDQLSAAVDFYGRIVYTETSPNKPDSPLDLADKLKCPLLGNFGETDQSIPVAQVEQLKDKLKGGAQPWKINVYPGAGHAFFNDTRPSFNAGAAKDAWSETLEWFKKYLG